MKEALELFIDYLFSKENKRVIIATHIDKNINSGKVMLKAGMKKDHTYDQEMVIKGKIEKLIGYSIKKE
jgi:RimJ/RimL family protein N-acetyltransferase